MSRIKFVSSWQAVYHLLLKHVLHVHVVQLTTGIGKFIYENVLFGQRLIFKFCVVKSHKASPLLLYSTCGSQYDVRMTQHKDIIVEMQVDLISILHIWHS